jgi:hypothetical protein
MATFEQQYLASKAAVHARKVYLTTSRALAIQARAKIKPASMRPNLLNGVRHSDLRGGDVIESHAKDDYFYYPSTVEFSRGATQGTPLTTSEWVKDVENAYDVSEQEFQQNTLEHMSESAGFVVPQNAQDINCGMGVKF